MISIRRAIPVIAAAAVCLLVMSVHAQDIPVRPGYVVVKLTRSAQASQALANNAVLAAELQCIGANGVTPFISSTVGAQSAAKKSVEVLYREEEVARIMAISYTSSESPWSVAARLAASPDVEYAEPWFLVEPAGTAFVPNDSLYASQAFLKTIQAAEAFDISQGSTDVIIAVADTDIKWDHPDLEANIYVNPGESGTDSQGRDKRTNGVDDDNDGLIDDWHGWDFAGANNTTPDNDTRSTTGGHGTQVSGLVGAVTDNRIGISSIGNKCRILPLKIGADGGGSLAFGYQAMDFASKAGAKVFNASWGSLGYSKSGEDVVNLALSRGMVVIGGAGNHGGSEPFYPAAYTAVIDAGVCDANDIIQGASGYGPAVDVISPGQGALTINLSNGYSTFGATSAAAPIVSGLAGLVNAHFLTYTPDQVRERIRVTCDNIDAKNPTRVKFAGKGRINAFRALNDPPTPSLRIVSTQIDDPNNDKRLDPGEDVGIVVTLKNWLAATPGPITLTLVPVTNASSVVIKTGTALVNAIPANATGSNSGVPLVFTVAAGAAFDATVLFRVDMTCGTYEDFDFVSVAVNPSFKAMQSNQLSMMVHANGMLGFRDYPNNTLGGSMLLGSTDLQLYLGSLMLGIDAAHVVDNARSAASFLARDDDFRVVNAVTIQSPSGLARAMATSRFTDANADSARRLNVEVTHEMFDYSNQGISDVLFSKYTVKNTGASAIKGLRAGLFMDFGGYPSYYVGTVAYDSVRHFGTVTKTGFPVVGTFVIDSLASANPARATFWAINNDPATGVPFGTLDGYTLAEKWRSLGSYPGLFSTVAGNVAYVISGSATDIAPGASASFVFGHTAGTIISVLKTRVDAAVNFWRNPTSVGVGDVPPTAASIALGAYPNPAGARGSVTVEFSLPYETDVRLELTSVLGTTSTMMLGRYERGAHHLTMPAGGLPAGMYLLRLQTAAGSVSRKFLLTD